jgi:hypothetical protein
MHTELLIIYFMPYINLGRRLMTKELLDVFFNMSCTVASCLSVAFQFSIYTWKKQNFFSAPNYCEQFFRERHLFKKRMRIKDDKHCIER